jgi:two-component system sensor histidine kinase UhpB
MEMTEGRRIAIQAPAVVRRLGAMERASPASQPMADLLLIVLASAVVFAIAVSTELSERITSISRGFERVQLDEVPLALLTFSLGLAWFAWRRWREMEIELRHRQLIEHALELKQVELRDLSQRITDAQESERRVLAHELHDELGQSLNAIKIEAVTIRNASRDRQPALHGAALSVIKLTDHVYGVVRDMTSRLRPVALDELGLVGALEHGLTAWRKLAPATEFRAAFRDVPEHMDEPVAMALYRVVQEGVTNILRHSGATQVAITLDSTSPPPGLHLSIRDDGNGADLGAIRRGLGLLGMRERIEGLGGTFAIVSQPGAGFRVDVTVPLRCPNGAGDRP